MGFSGGRRGRLSSIDLGEPILRRVAVGRENQPRFRPSSFIQVVFVTGSTAGRGVAENVSREGLFIRTPLLPQPGERIRVTLRTAGRPEIDVQGEVRWNSKNVPAEDTASGFGVAISQCDFDYAALVGRVAGEHYATSEDA